MQTGLYTHRRCRYAVAGPQDRRTAEPRRLARRPAHKLLVHPRKDSHPSTPASPQASAPAGCRITWHHSNHRTLGKSPSLAFLPRADSPSNIPSQPLLTNHRLVAHPCSALVAVAPPRLDMFNPGAEPGPSKRRAPKTASGENKVYVCSGPPLARTPRPPVWISLPCPGHPVLLGIYPRMPIKHEWNVS